MANLHIEHDWLLDLHNVHGWLLDLHIEHDWSSIMIKLRVKVEFVKQRLPVTL